MNYQLDNMAHPGLIIVSAEGHQTYAAETWGTAELFAKRLTSQQPIPLPQTSESTKLDNLYAAVDRVLTRLEFDRLADQLIADRERLGLLIEAQFVTLP